MNEQGQHWIAEALREGFAALTAGHLAAASECCRRVLAAAPELVEAHFLVGLVAIELQDRATAVSAFGSVTRLRPKHGAAWAQLARLFMQAGQPNRADQALHEAVEHEAGDPLVQDLIGTVYSQLGDQLAARHWYAKAASQRPEHPGYGVNLANSLVFLGEAEAAERQLKQVLARHPDNPQAHWLLSGVRRARDRSHVESLVRQIAVGNMPTYALAFLYYGLGKELEDLQEWQRAFEAFSRGAAARRQTLEFDERAEAASYETLTQTFTREWLGTGTRGSDDPSPIFVVGQPRTGTTLVERIITSHSEVRSAGELQQFGLSIRRLVDEQIPGRFPARLMHMAAAVDARALGEGYLSVTARRVGDAVNPRPDAARFVDKLPSNFLYIPLILKALPNAKIVHVVRQPMDACFASFKQLFADAYPHSYDQQEMARHFARYHRLMATWRERFPNRFFDIRYEEVVRDLEPSARALLDYLGLPWEDACLAFHEQDGAVATASAVQVREPAHTRSIGRWLHYEVELAPMRAALQAEGIAL